MRNSISRLEQELLLGKAQHSNIPGAPAVPLEGLVFTDSIHKALVRTLQHQEHRARVSGGAQLLREELQADTHWSHHNQPGHTALPAPLCSTPSVGQTQQPLSTLSTPSQGSSWALSALITHVCILLCNSKSQPWPQRNLNLT